MKKYNNNNSADLLLLATGSILRMGDMLLQYLPQTFHQLLLIGLYFLDFHLGVLQHTEARTCTQTRLKRFKKIKF